MWALAAGYRKRAGEGLMPGTQPRRPLCRPAPSSGQTACLEARRTLCAGIVLGLNGLREASRAGTRRTLPARPKRETDGDVA
jgi:hypothetical protein